MVTPSMVILALGAILLAKVHTHVERCESGEPGTRIDFGGTIRIVELEKVESNTTKLLFDSQLSGN